MFYFGAVSGQITSATSVSLFSNPNYQDMPKLWLAVTTEGINITI
jgi:hypothetical protein